MASYEQWTDERLERGIRKFEEAIHNDIEDFLEALQYNSHKLRQMRAERQRRQASTSEQQHPVEVAS
jgi:hypothetical protein